MKKAWLSNSFLVQYSSIASDEFETETSVIMNMMNTISHQVKKDKKW